MKFRNIEEAVNTIVDSYKASKKAISMGDSKTNNKIILKKMNPAFKFLEDNNAVDSLIVFLKSDDIDLRIMISRKLLPHYEEIAVEVLNDIIQKKIPNKWDIAQIVLKEWKGIPL